MTAFSTLQQGIKAIKEGNTREGARLIRLALKEPDLSRAGHAQGNIWLAHIAVTDEDKLAYLEKALEAEPDNEFAQKRYAQINTPVIEPPPTLPEAPPTSPTPAPVYHPAAVVMEQTAPPPPPTLPEQPTLASMSTSHFVPIIIDAQGPQQPTMTTSQIVGLSGGPNGLGSGFFISHRGVIATTHFVVGGLEYVDVLFESGQRQRGRVIRAFPELDIALVHVEQETDYPLPASPFPDILPYTPLTVMCHNQQMQTGIRRDTDRDLPAHWIPTDITKIPDAGGGPVFDDHHYVVGMITRNISDTAAYVHAVHITTIRNCLDIVTDETRTSRARVYCPTCGHTSTAAGQGGYYCDHCGAVMPQAPQNRIRTPQVMALYEERSPRLCTNPKCQARVGYFNGHCMRCGEPQADLLQGETRP